MRLPTLLVCDTKVGRGSQVPGFVQPGSYPFYVIYDETTSHTNSARTKRDRDMPFAVGYGAELNEAGGGLRVTWFSGAFGDLLTETSFLKADFGFLDF